MSEEARLPDVVGTMRLTNLSAVLVFLLAIFSSPHLYAEPAEINTYGHISMHLTDPSQINFDALSVADPSVSIPLVLRSDDHLQVQSALRPHIKRSTLLEIHPTVESRYVGLMPFWVNVALYILLTVITLVLIYTVRHYVFTMNRVFGTQRHPYADIDVADWPRVTVFIAAHNEEAVIMQSLEALLDVDYPIDRLQIMPVNDRSTDTTKEIIDAFVARYPGRIEPFHRVDGKPGKSAALKDATLLASGDILIVFDADYVPGRGLIRQLVAPFFDPEVGAVMGRVVPLNTGANLLTRLLDMERSGGYQVDQQARMNMRLVPQYGGTVGGTKREALEAVGGWRDDALAEDTDLTYRLLLGGWKTVYQNRSECYEESPEAWPVRVRQIMRWSKGHNQAAVRYTFGLFKSGAVSWREKCDGILLLGVFAMSPILMLGWISAIFLYYFSSNDWLVGALALFALMTYSALGNFAAFFEIGAAVYLDGSRERLRLMPLNFFGFLISMMSITRATFNQIVFDTILKQKFVWDKTVRYRSVLPTVKP